MSVLTSLENFTEKIVEIDVVSEAESFMRNNNFFTKIYGWILGANKALDELFVDGIPVKQKIITVIGFIIAIIILAAIFIAVKDKLDMLRGRWLAKVVLLSVCSFLLYTVPKSELKDLSSFIFLLYIVLILYILLANIVKCRLIPGIMFTILEVGISSFIKYFLPIIVVVIIIRLIFTSSGGKKTVTSSPSSNTTAKYVRDVNSNEVYYVEQSANGTQFVDPQGRNSVLRKSDYDGRYIDSDGNQYVE